MHDPLINHDEISKVQGCPCHIKKESHEESHRRQRPSAHEHVHEHGEHVHDGRPHVHMPDGTVRYLEEGELPSAPKRRRTPTQE